ncbi:hypothetical protein Ancab_001003 [Ancistrocladus abbreviatus]
MANSSTNLLSLTTSLCLCFLACYTVVALQQQNKCQIESLCALEPIGQIWDLNDEQLRCANVAVSRHVIEPKGLLLPTYNSAPMLVYALKGSPQQLQGRKGEKGFQDQHQKLRHFREGDVLAMPTGVAHWCYNPGETQLVLFVVHDISNPDNQLDQFVRDLFLAGNPGKPEYNLFQVTETEILAKVYGVSMETARMLQSKDDKRGAVVKVENELELRMLLKFNNEEEQSKPSGNCLEESICALRFTQNIGDLTQADIYTHEGGWISTASISNLPMLRYIRLSAQRGYLYEGAIISPHWNMNAHSIVYVIRGSARVQVIGTSNKPIFSGVIRAGQVLIIPQSYAAVVVAGSQGFKWVSFKTSEDPKVSMVAGLGSVMRSMPEGVLVNVYKHIPRVEVRKLKYNREGFTILRPWPTAEAKVSA